MSQPALVPQGSNYTFLAKVTLGSHTIDAIYKPRDGERPLWDFPPGTLYLREYAALSGVTGPVLGLYPVHRHKKRPIRSRVGSAVHLC